MLLIQSFSMNYRNLVILSWDLFYQPHFAFNQKLLDSLPESINIVVFSLPSYYANKFALLQNLKYDSDKRVTRVSKKKQYMRFVKLPLERLRGAFFRYSVYKSLKRPNISIVDAASIFSNDGNRALLLNINRASSLELFSMKLDQVDIGAHLVTDMSLDCKNVSKDLPSGSIELENLRNTTAECITALKALSKIIPNLSGGDTIFVSTSVYSLDWACKQHVEQLGFRHVFIESSVGIKDHCKIYANPSADMLARRTLQFQLNQSFLPHVKPKEYALTYLRKRFSASSAHRYSPNSTETDELSQLSRAILLNPESDVWVYFTNSPDELHSAMHDHSFSGLDAEMPWNDSGVAQDEYEAIEIVGKLAREEKAILVVRQHPRLQSDHRSPFVSSQYDAINDCVLELQAQSSDSVVIFQPSSRVNSYELALWSDRVISFRGTMPLEVSLMGLKPIVLAKKKGFMNYQILLHSESAPDSLGQLRELLKSSSCHYSPEDLQHFVDQFYISRALSLVRLASPGEAVSQLWPALCSTVYSEYRAPSLPNLESIDLGDVDSQSWSLDDFSDYLSEVKKVVERFIF